MLDSGRTLEKRSPPAEVFTQPAAAADRQPARMQQAPSSAPVMIPEEILDAPSPPSGQGIFPAAASSAIDIPQPRPQETPAETSAAIKELQLRVILAEDRLGKLEQRLSSARALIALHLLILAGAAVYGYFRLRRPAEKRETAPGSGPADENIDHIMADGVASYRAGRLEDALVHFNRALSAHPDLAAGYLYRGNILFRLRQFEKADLDYRRMFHLDPGNRSAFLSVAELYLTTGHYARVLEILEQGAPNNAGPEAKALFAFFEFAARILAGLETSGCEARFRAAMENEFVLSWSLREIVRWLQSTALPAGAGSAIIALVQELRTRGGRLTGIGLGVYPETSAEEWDETSWENVGRKIG